MFLALASEWRGAPPAASPRLMNATKQFRIGVNCRIPQVGARSCLICAIAHLESPLTRRVLCLFARPLIGRRAQASAGHLVWDSRNTGDSL